MPMSGQAPQVSRSEVRVALAAVVVGIALLVLKFAAYVITGSAAIFSDAMESIVNVVASSVALYALLYAARPADAGHPYGHGKIEFVSAGLEGGMIVVASVAIIVKTVDTLLFHTIDIQDLGIGLAMMTVAMVVNGTVGLALVRIGRRQHSITLEADGRHLLIDAFTSVAAIIALVIVKVFNFPPADPIAALLMAGYIGWTGWGLVRRSFAGLMDEQDAGDDRTLRQILDSHVAPDGPAPRICSYHKLRHRHSGRYHWVDFHIVVPATLSVDEGHAIASAIEYEIEQALGVGNATAHVEPCEDVDCAHCHRRD